MRTISPASVAILGKKTGVEPVIVVRVWWSRTTYIAYCDRKFETDDLVGKLLEISGIEDVVDINAAASSVSLSVTLDDSDGSIKTIYDAKDIHKVRVQILQWFNGIPLSEAFVIFEGELSSPIEWAEGTRTLRFDVVTKLEDLEVGFSAEEGKFEFIPSSSIGKAWPIVFGRVAGLKILQLTEAPSAILASGFGVVDSAIWEAELDDLEAAIAKAILNAQNAHNLGVAYAIIAGTYKPFGGPKADDPDQALQYDNAAQSYFAQANDYSNEYYRLDAERQGKIADRAHQQSLQFRVLPITQTNLPVGTPITVEIGNYTTTAVVVNNSITLGTLVEKVDINQRTGTNAYRFGEKTDEYKREARGQKFTWVDGGTTIKIFNFPRYYIVSLGTVNVINVWARNKFGKAVVPRSWYTVTTGGYGSGLYATQLVFPTPITSYPGDWQDGDIEVDCASTIGPNVVDIMRWVINRFCTFDIDETSFNHVENKLANYPANFALTERLEIVRFLQDVAFQSRCAIWLNDRKFYLRYLPERQTPIDTITDDDVELNSIVLSSTDTERLVTKFTAVWRERLNQTEPNKIIYRYNTKKYGVHEEEYDFYIYNNHDLVAKSAQFWMIRKSNTFKRITCKVMLHKLKIETFDPVTFDFTQKIAADTAVVGIIEKSTFNPDDDTLSIEAWLPVRLGDMEIYKFAQPMNVTDVYPVRNDDNVITGNPYDAATGTLAPIASFAPTQQITYSRFDPFTHGTGLPAGDAGDEAPGSLVTALSPSNINQSRPAGIEQFNNEKKYFVNPITEATFTKATPATFYGRVIQQTDVATYDVAVYLRGFRNEPTVMSITLGLVRNGSKLPEGYPLIIYRTVWFGSSGVGIQNANTIEFEYWAQPPIWVPAPIEDEDVF